MSAQLEDILTQAGEKQVSGASVLNDVRAFINRFCVFPSDHCANAVTLWATLTHAIDCFYTAPRLALLSPEPSAGKTRVLEILNLLIPNPMFSFGASAATIYRSLAERQISLLFDEVDTIWSNRGNDDSHEDLRALLNAGYKRGATVPRCVGKNYEVQEFNVFCAVALAGIGELPETILSRSIIIKMRRRAPDEPVEPFRTRLHESDGHALRNRLAAWMDEVGEAAGNAWPSLPNGIVDRPAEIWEPLIAVADAAGGEWPSAARQACNDLCSSAQDRQVSLGIRLLGDLKKIFDGRGGEEISERLSTAFILDMLVSEHLGLDDDAPWGDMYGKPIDSRKLANLLKPYGIKSTKVKIDGLSLRGYPRERFVDSWNRWLPVTPSQAEPPEPRAETRVVEPFLGSGQVPEVPEPSLQAEPEVEPGKALEPLPLLGSEKKVPEVPQVPANRGCPEGVGDIHVNGHDEVLF